MIITSKVSLDQIHDGRWDLIPRALARIQEQNKGLLDMKALNIREEGIDLLISWGPDPLLMEDLNEALELGET